eukprot:30621-Eustigmatos_ZCMA.PRE.1
MRAIDALNCRSITFTEPRPCCLCGKELPAAFTNDAGWPMVASCSMRHRPGEIRQISNLGM